MPHSTDKFTQKTAQPAPKRTFRIELAWSTIVAIVAVVLGFALLSQLAPVILVLITALMLVGTLNPAVEWLGRRNIPRFTSIAIVFIALMIVLIALAVFTVPPFIAQVVSLVKQEPELRGRLIHFLSMYPITESLAGGLRHIEYTAIFKSYSNEAMAFSKSLFSIIAYGAGSFFLALYIMIDRDRLRGALFAVIPRAHHIKLARIMLNLETIVGGYVRGQVLTCVLMAVFLFILLSACGVPNALAIAAFGGIVDVLPFVGIFLTMVPAVLAALAVGGVAATVVCILLLCYEEFESRILIPIVYGRSLRLPSSIVLFALIAGGTLYGIGGALLALPVAATLLMLVDELKVELPGESAQAKDLAVQMDDIVGEAEYLRRTDGMTAEAAAGIALEISEDRKLSEEEQALKDAIPVENA
ncbi:AI-2E family transporter [Undibacterium sp. TJN19]|uniref:AI-2E family transporter n=1 Tax=Undibacterium sp. TJN19 TaxID=3413055 RepID=UPI003BF39CE6